MTTVNTLLMSLCFQSSYVILNYVHFGNCSRIQGKTREKAGYCKSTVVYVMTKCHNHHSFASLKKRKERNNTWSTQHQASKQVPKNHDVLYNYYSLCYVLNIIYYFYSKQSNTELKWTQWPHLPTNPIQLLVSCADIWHKNQMWCTAWEKQHHHLNCLLQWLPLK